MFANMKGGNGASETSVVTLCLNYAYQKTQPKTFPGRGRSPQNKKREFPPALAFILLRLRNYYLWVRFRTYSSPAAPSNSSAHVDGSGISFALNRLPVMAYTLPYVASEISSYFKSVKSLV